jgi:glutamate N-acetyltransferase/amino-acid N-acetyltransferase
MAHLETKDKIFPVKGIRLNSVAAGIRYKNRNDLVLVEMAQDTEVAAMFTTNAFCAAPVTLARQHLATGKPRYLLINSGNANAGTGKAGDTAAAKSCDAVSAVTGCDPSQVLPFSTGVIGELLPVEKISSALAELHHGLDHNKWQLVAEAIMTTDTVPKLISRQVEIDGKRLTINGIAKGSGMIRPNMATMLSYIATDARVANETLQASLERAVNHSFNRITVDGDTSTNDAVVLMATGQGDVQIDNANLAKFQEVLDEVCTYLARAIVLDGEGATKLINVVVEQGASDEECAKVAYAIAHSPLVKTAFFASDPNWGRILAAVGYAGVPDLKIDNVQLYLDDICIVEAGGRADSYTEEQGQQVMQQSEITIRVVLNRGASSTTVWTCDFSYDYVKINADYRS